MSAGRQRSPDKYRLFHRESSFVPLGDDIPYMFEMDPKLLSHDSTDREDDEGRQRVRSRHYLLCCLLHIFLVVLHLTLLVIPAFHRPEHRIVITSASEFTIGLSGGLQAFYTLYTTLLVFVTQQLMLSTVFSRLTKLTRIHDICSAWYGLGAALSTLWQQTKVASSVFSIILVTLYFVCVSVLHVASSTIMEFQPFNATVTSTVSAVAAWPDSLSDLTSPGWEYTVLALAPYMQDLYGNKTQGLVNNTLYDVPSSAFVNATVNSTTLNAHCGLLTNLSATDGDESLQISASMAGLDPVNFMPYAPPLPNEIWVSIPQSSTRPFITFLVSAEIKPDESVTGTSHIYINGTFSPPGGAAQNFTTRAYLVACSFDTTTATIALESSSILISANEQPASATWPMFSSGGNANLSYAIISAMIDSTVVLPKSAQCQPVMSDPYWQNMSVFNANIVSSLGIDVSSCNGTSVQQYTGTPYLLTRETVENVISKIAARFVWIAGRLNDAGGGFNRQTGTAQITEDVLKWRLNINLLPVISSLSASVVLCILVACMRFGRNAPQTTISSAGILEIMWFGSRSTAFRDHLCGIYNPSLSSLRALSMSTVTLRSQYQDVHVTDQQFKDLRVDTLSCDVAGHAHPGVFEHDYIENLQLNPQSHRTWDASLGRRWCYALHTVLVVLHIVLLLLLVHHPEHLVIIPLETTTFTTSLSALLQAIYTIYTALLVFVLQRLSLSKMVGERRKLTAVHDVSGAWTGVGTAILVLWQQRRLAAAPLEVLIVVIYLASILVLHVASSSIMQWQAFDNSLFVGFLQSNLALPYNVLNISQLEWSQISLIGCSTAQDSNLSTYGLSSSTIYDIPQVPDNVVVSEAIVNATTIGVQCGLVPNLTLLSDNLYYSDPAVPVGQYQIGFSLNGSGNNTLLGPPMWKDLLHRIDGQCADCPQTLFYMITAAVDVDESVHDPVALKLNWTYASPSGENPQSSTTLTYIAACSFTSRTVPAMVNIQEQELVPPPNQTDIAVSSNTSWSVWSPAAATDLGVGMVTAFSQFYMAYGGTVISGNFSGSYSTSMDGYLMSLLGLDWAFAQNPSPTQSSADPSVTLTPARLENAISQTAARFMWVAGQLGEGNGFERAVGESPAIRDVQQYRLNINTIPVVIASAASFVALAVAILILGRKPIKERLSSVSGTSVLESLWLEANSKELHSRLQAVDGPYPDKLREAGMFDIRLGNIKAGCLLETSEPEELPLNDLSENDMHDLVGDP